MSFTMVSQVRTHSNSLKIICKLSTQIIKLIKYSCNLLNNRIGDNPKSDIRGANGFGGIWKSVLVRSGIFQGKENDEEDPA